MSCLDRLNHGFSGNAELLEEFPGRGRGAEAAHADEGTAGLDPALPPERPRRLDGDVQRAGPEHLVAVVRRLLLEELPGRHGDDGRRDALVARSDEHTSETPVTNAHLVCRL